MTRAFTEISFTPSVLALQKQNGSAEAYSKFMARRQIAQTALVLLKLSSSQAGMASIKRRYQTLDGLMCSFAAALSGFLKCGIIKQLPMRTSAGTGNI